VGRRRAFREDLFRHLPQQADVLDLRLGIRDKDGYYFILGRTDDVINVAGIAWALARSKKRSACTRTSGMRRGGRGRFPQGSDAACLRGGEGHRYAGTKTGRSRLEKEVLETVDKQLGAIARPKSVHFVSLLPKTRSGKTLRRTIQALAEGRDPVISPPSRTRRPWSRFARVENQYGAQEVKTNPA